MQKGLKPLTPRVMLGWGLWVFRSPVYSLHVSWRYFFDTTIRDIVLFYWVHMFAGEEIFIKLTNLWKKRLASLKYKLKETLFAFSVNSAVQKLKK